MALHVLSETTCSHTHGYINILHKFPKVIITYLIMLALDQQNRNHKAS